MTAFIARRLLATIPVLVLVALFVFLMLRLTPGDPAAIIAGDSASPDQIEDIRDRLGLNDPLPTQLVIWSGKLLQGDFGERSEEHTSELQSLMRISYAVFCLKKKNNTI